MPSSCSARGSGVLPFGDRPPGFHHILSGMGKWMDTHEQAGPEGWLQLAPQGGILVLYYELVNDIYTILLSEQIYPCHEKTPTKGMCKAIVFMCLRSGKSISLLNLIITALYTSGSFVNGLVIAECVIKIYVTYGLCICSIKLFFSPYFSKITNLVIFKMFTYLFSTHSNDLKGFKNCTCKRTYKLSIKI